MHEFADSEVPTARQLTQHSGALRALGHCLLQDQTAVDDLVQDTYVAALQHPSRRPAGLRSWLTAVARNLAYRHGRTERRRQRREAVAARPELVSSAAEVAAETELLRHIGSLVHELEEPYRTAVHLRFWHGMTPTEIAAHLDVPFNTVRTRLQRGLEKLRNRLDREHGQRQAWAAPLLSMVSPGAAAPTAGVMASVTTGALVMKSKWILGGAAVLLLGLGYWASRPPDPAHSGELEPGHPAARQVANEDPNQQATSDPSGKPPGSARQAVDPTKKRITLRGRCVDSVSSQPVADCIVRVRALDQRHQLDASYTSPSPVQTAANGRFTIHCDAAQARLQLLIDAKDAVALSAWWENLRAGDKVDVGDVSIQPGCVAVGRVTDTAGMARPGVTITVTCLGGGGYLESREKVAPTGELSLTSGVNGALQAEKPLPPGKWLVRVEPPHHWAKRGMLYLVEVSKGETSKQLDVVVLRELGAITGRVLDQQSLPVAGAEVRGEPKARGFADIKAVTDAGGRFRLPHIEGTPAGPMRLKVSCKGFESRRTRQRYPWGTERVKIVLSRVHRLPLQLSVVEAGSGTPITEFAIRIATDPRITRRVARQDWRRQLAGHHQGGQVSIPILAGSYILWVEPLQETWAASGLRQIRMTREGLPVQRIELQRNRTRTLQVVDGQNKTVDGTRVQLVKQQGRRAVELRTPVGGIEELPRLLVRQNGAWLVQEGVTRDGGTLQLAAAPASDYVLRLLGPGHTPIVVPGVVLADDLAPLRVVVPRGATIVGRIVPKEALAQMQPGPRIESSVKAMKPEQQKGWAHYFPHLWLVPASGTPGVFPAERGGVAVGKDGRFRIDQVPPGSWEVTFRYSMFSTETPLTRTAVLGTIPDLRAGEVRKVTMDARALVPGQLRARVFLDGKPVTEHQIRIRRRSNKVGTMDQPILASTDKQGRMKLAMPPGQFQVEITIAKDGKRHRLKSAASLHVPPGGTVEHAFELFWSRLKLRIVDADNKPVTDRKFYIHSDHALWRLGTPNANGELILEPVPLAEPFDIVAWPRELEDTKRRQQFRKARRQAGRTWTDVLIRAGTIQAPLGQKEKTVELRMPR